MLSTDLIKGLICQVEKKDSRNRRLREHLVQYLTFEAGVSLLNAAKIRGDQRVLLEVEGCDVITKEVLYHKSCFGLLTHKKVLGNLTSAKV